MRASYPARYQGAPPPRSQVRVGDGERERAVQRLRGAYADGRLSSEEFEERLSLAFAAQTRRDLQRLTRDLPRDRDMRERAGRAAFRWHAATYLTVNGGLVVSWLATGGPFWPAGSIGPWGGWLALHAYARRRASRRRRHAV